MLNKGFKFCYYLVILLIGILSFGLGFTNFSKTNPHDVYRVYVDGKIIGTVQSKDSFDSYINMREEAIKKILATKTKGSVWTKQELDELGMTESELKKLSNESSKEIFEIA